MKKILSFTLVLAMILGSVSFCFAERTLTTATYSLKGNSFTDVTADMDCYNAVEVLKAIGAIDGTSAGRFQPDYALTRAQIVAFVVKALGYPVTEGNSYVTKFADVPATEWYAGYVYWASTLGIVEGRTATKFDPNAKVTADEATAFILRILGYNDTVTGGYPAGYILAANKLGFYDVISAGSAAVTRGETAQLVYAIADEPMGTIVTKDMDILLATGKKVGDFYAVEEDADTLFAKHDCYVGEPIAVDYACIAKKETLCDLSAYLGDFVAPIFKADAKDNRYLVGVSEVYTETLTGLAVSYVKNVATWTLGGKYFEEEGKTSVTTNVYQNLSVDKKETKFSTTSKDTYKVVLDETTGKIKSVNAVLKADTIKNAVVLTATEGLDKVYTESSATNAASINAVLNGIQTYTFPAVDAENKDFAIDYSKVEMVGATKVEDLKAGDVVYIYAKTNNEIFKLEVANKTVTGYVTDLRVDSDGISYATVDGTEYTFRYVDNTGINAGTEYVFNLGYDGKVLACAATTEKTNYAVFLKYYPGQVAGSSLSAASEADGFGLFTYEGKELKAYATKALTESASYASVQAIAAGTVVKYSVTEDGKISGITEYALTDNRATKVTEKGVIGNYAFKDSSVVFVYDATATTKTSPEAIADCYKVVKASSLYGVNVANVKFAEYKGYVTAATLTLTEGTELENAYMVVAAATKTTFENKYVFKNTLLNLANGEKEYFYTEENVFKKGADEIYTLTVSGTGFITSYAAIELDGSFELPETKATALTVSGDVVMDGEKVVMTLADDAVVYLNNNGTISAADKALLSGLYKTNIKSTSKNMYNAVYFVNDLYDEAVYVVVTTKSAPALAD